MIAKDVSVGLTYEVLISDKLVPVKLTKDCTYGGGWYGKNLATGHTVRIKTAGRLRKQLTGEIAASTEAAKQDSAIHTATKEAPMGAKFSSKDQAVQTDAKAARAARRAKAEPSASEKLDAALSTAKTTAKAVNEAASKSNQTPRNAKGQIQSRKSNPTPTEEVTVKSTPKRKPAAKPAVEAPFGLKADGTPRKRPVPTWLNGDKPAAKSNGTVKISGKSTAKRAPKLAAAPVEVDIDAIVAAAVAEALAKAAPAAKVTAKRAPAKKAEAVTVKLKAANPVVNSYQFKYMGKDEQPLVTATYVMLPLLERFAQDGEAVEIAFTEYVPTGKQKPQPKSKIRYSGSDETIRDLYVDRAAITKLGYSESNCPVVTVKVVSDDTITLTFPAA